MCCSHVKFELVGCSVLMSMAAMLCQDSIKLTASGTWHTEANMGKCLKLCVAVHA